MIFKSTTNASLQVKALPNPSNTNFKLIVKGNSTEEIKMIVVDIYGRTVEQRMLQNEQTTTLGDNTGREFIL